MTNNILNPDEWYDEYEEASVKQRYQMLLDIMQQPLSEEFLEDTEMAELLITMSDELHSNNLNDKALSLIKLIAQQQPKFYKKEFAFYDKFLVEYYLYTKQDNLIEDALTRFKKYPSIDIEQLFAVLDLLVFYEKPEITVNLCKAIYKSVKNKSNLMSGTEDELAWLIITNLMEQVYQQHQQGTEINWTKFKSELQTYGYDKDREWLEDVKSILTTEFNREEFLSRYKQKKLHSRAFNSLSTGFYIYMKQEKQMSFVCSQGIWETIFDFLGSRELSFKQEANPNTFFTFTQKDIEPYLSNKLHGFLSMQQAQGFATLWGIPYLYDFLLAQGIIREQVHRKVITITNQLKAELLKAYQDNWQLWRYDFINRWQPDSNTSSSEIANQIQFFQSSFVKSEPLSDIPGEGVVESFFSEMAEKLGFDFEQLKNANDELEELEDNDRPLISESKTRETKSKPVVNKTKSKKKKSNLGLAAQLYKKEK